MAKKRDVDFQAINAEKGVTALFKTRHMTVFEKTSEPGKKFAKISFGRFGRNLAGACYRASASWIRALKDTPAGQNLGVNMSWVHPRSVTIELTLPNNLAQAKIKAGEMDELFCQMVYGGMAEMATGRASMRKRG
jgi:hypothetical protein